MRIGKKKGAGKHFKHREEQNSRRPHVVCMGGGTGQSNTISALRLLGCDVSAVVSMVDDGGSTGILRSKAGMLAAGDVRRCLSALASDPSDPLSAAFEFRFPYADNHSLGNLMLTALTYETQSFAEAVDICGRLLKIHGRVLPCTLDAVRLRGRTKDGREFSGECSLGSGPSALEQVWLEPADVRVYAPVLDAIEQADALIFGPGSLFTSIIPNLLVPGIVEALGVLRKKREVPFIFIGPMADMQGETWGLSLEEHLAALEAHGLLGMIDTLLLHKTKTTDLGLATRSFRALTGDQIKEYKELHTTQERVRMDLSIDSAKLPAGSSSGFIRSVDLSEDMLKRLSESYDLVITRDFSEPEQPTWHSPQKLAAILKEVIPACRLRQS